MITWKSKWRLGLAVLSPFSFVSHLLTDLDPQMTHFILLLDSYVKSIIIEQSWIILKEEFENRCSSIDSIYEAHSNYIKRILFR